MRPRGLRGRDKHLAEDLATITSGEVAVFLVTSQREYVSFLAWFLKLLSEKQAIDVLKKKCTFNLGCDFLCYFRVAETKV